MSATEPGTEDASGTVGELIFTALEGSMLSVGRVAMTSPVPDWYNRRLSQPLLAADNAKTSQLKLLNYLGNGTNGAREEVLGGHFAAPGACQSTNIFVASEGLFQAAAWEPRDGYIAVRGPDS
jgi:hypothetical protein